MPASRPASQRVLATVLFTDVVASTEHAARLGDRRWTELLERYLDRSGAITTKQGGVELTSAGDGLVARFDTPARALTAARQSISAARRLGLELRAGCHAGELESRGTDVRGIALHIAARILGIADPGEVLVSSTVKDLVAGSTLRFADRGLHALRGVPGEWRVFALAGVGGTRAPQERTRSIMIVDDHPMWRETLRKVLEAAGAGSVVAEASDGEEAVQLALVAQPDVIIMDMHLRTVGGAEATRRVLLERPETHVLVLSSSDRKSDVLDAVRAGARGYLLKTVASTELVAAVERAHRGELVFPPELAGLVLGALRDG